MSSTVTVVESGPSKLIRAVFSSEEYYMIYAKVLSIHYKAELNSSDLILLAHLLRYEMSKEFTITYALKQLLSTGRKINPEAFNNSTRKLINSGIIEKMNFRKYKFSEKLYPEITFKLLLNSLDA
jgi:hypothetical protein